MRQNTSEKRERMIEIPYDAAPCDDFLCDGDGRPVWPIRAPQDLQALQKMSAMLGTVRLSQTVARPATQVMSANGAGAVAALAPKLERHGQLYAHLTQRRWIGLLEAGNVNADAGLEVLLLRRDQLDPALLSSLYGDDALRTAPGLLFAATGTISHRQLLCRAIAAAAPPRPQQIACEAFMMIDFEAMSLGNSLILGNRAAASQKHAALAGGADVVTFLTHSDGVDSYVDPLLTLCPMDNNRLSSRERRPACQITGTCFRHNMPVADALKSGKLISPTEVRTRVLNWIVCNGLLLSTGAISPAWGLVEDILDRAAVGAVTTTWTTAVVAPADLQWLLSTLYSGDSLGSAIRHYNRKQEAGLLLAVLGDPAIRVFDADGKGLSAGHPMFGLAKSAREPQSELPESGSGTALYLHAARRCCAAPLYPALDAAITHIEAGSAPDARLKIIEFITGRGVPISTDWLPFATGWHAAPATACHSCGMDVSQRGFTLPLPAGAEGGERYLAICPACGLIGDAPRAESIRISVSGQPGTVELHGPVTSHDWTARLRIRCSDGALYLRDWPAAPQGAPVRRLHCDGLNFPGPLQVSLIFVEGTEISIATVPHTLDRLAEQWPTSPCLS